MGKIYINLKNVSFVSNTDSLPQDGQRLISKIKEDAKSHKAFNFEFEDHIQKDESERTMDEKLEKYRNQLIEIEQEVGESFLKTILTLSGGALGISFAFIKNVVGKGPIKASDTLIVAWTFLTISLASVLLSLFSKFSLIFTHLFAFGVFFYYYCVKLRSCEKDTQNQVQLICNQKKSEDQ